MTNAADVVRSFMKTMMAEWPRVRNGKIEEIRVVFDARPFAAMSGK